MNFYARQTQARQQTRRLVVLFALAVLAVVLAVNLVVLALLASTEGESPGTLDSAWLAGHAGSFLVTSLLVLGVIAVSSLYKTAVLRGGGGVVARSLGGTRLEREQQDPLRRRLHNVVEEMAIASGVPMPEVYVLEQEGAINAFAAGHSPANAAIAVTRGALEKLNRAELQGVIAHEFSHILNGDMRLNIQLMGLLFGLLVIALIGRTVLRHAGRGSGKKGGVAVVLLAALAVMILGYIGVFFGRLIQAAVARQREALADSSAVQFTREPQGLKGALVKIGGFELGSKLQDTGVEEVAHMLFAPGMARLFATHPPLIERIRALDPSFEEREFLKVRFEPELGLSASSDVLTNQTLPSLEAGSAGLTGKVSALAPGAVAAMVGNPGTQQIQAAQAVAQSLPADLLGSLQAPGRALGLLFALVLDPKPEIRAQQTRILRERLGEKTLALIESVQDAATRLEPFQRLPTLGEVFPALRRLPREDRRSVLECLQRLILVDGRIEIFEYALGRLTRVYLQDELNPGFRPRSLKLDQASAELQVLFSTLAQHGNGDEKEARRAYEIGMHHLLPQYRPDYRPIPGWPAALDHALKCLDQLPPEGKEQLVEALVKTVALDQQITLNEAELLRTICASLHCPLPPLLKIRNR